MGDLEFRRLMLAGCSLAVLLGGSASASAESVGQVVSDDIVVTARRKVERLQDVPISVSSFGSEEIGERGSIRIRDLTASVPNMAFIGGENSSLSIVTVRGITSQTRLNPGFDSSLGVYVDGVVQGKLYSFNQDLADVQRVEFLRGPQGTLFGKNAASGAINIVTRTPGDTFEANVDADLSNYNGRRFSAYVGGPVSDSISASIALTNFDRDGYIKNLATGDRIADEDMTQARAKIVFRPSERLNITLSGDTLRENQHPVVSHIISGYGYVADAGLYTSNVDIISLNHRTVHGGALTGTYDLGDDLQIVSITGYREARSRRENDGDIGPGNTTRTDVLNDQNQFSQELRLDKTRGALQFVAGLYYLNQKVDGHSSTTFLSTPASIFSVLRNVTGSTFGSVTYNSYAAFVNADYTLTSQLTASAGVRYTRDEKKLDYAQTGFPLGLAPTLGRQVDKSGEGDVSPTVSLRFKPSDDITSYVTISKGFKSGGWNVDNITSSAITQFSQLRFGPERVWNFEAGFKSMLFDRRLTFNAAVFHMKYSDIQTAALVPAIAGSAALVSVVTNAAKARSNGFEAEIVAKPFPGLEISAGGGYSDAKYSRYLDTTSGGATLDFSGNYLPYAPKWTGNASVVYSHDLGENLGVRIRADVNHTDSYFVDRSNLVAYKTEAQTFLNASVTLQSKASPGWDVTLYARNLTKESPVISRSVGGFAVPIGLGTSALEAYAPPRIYGVRIGWHY